MDSDAFKELLAQYDYTYPHSAVALTPAHPRESAKMQVYTRATGQVDYATFAELPHFLPKDALLVFNNTKVIPARLFVELKKETGQETVEMFVTHIGADGYSARVLSNRKVDVGDTLHVAGVEFELVAKEGKESVVRIVRDSTSYKTVRDVIEEAGKTPIPPYLKETQMSEEDLRREYQSIFARYDGSVAAPTASLHFSETLVEALDAAGIERAFVTLHVGLGTFAPLTTEHVAEGRLHEEKYEVPAETLDALCRAHATGQPIIPVGTTALRTLESIADVVLETSTARSRELSGDFLLSGSTSLFITPGYQFRLASGLITNFHIPQSSLMMLVAALVGREKLLVLYEEAIARDFRFFSFGDGMLIV